MLASRLALALPVLILSTFLVFSILELVPGDIAVTLAGESATPERLQEIRNLYGLERPFLVQYLGWLSNAAQGNLSKSLFSGAQVSDLIVNRLPNTLMLTTLSLALSVAVGVPLGIIAARNSDTVIDNAVRMLTTLFVAIPTFWLGMILVSYFALTMGWFPATGAVPLSDGVWRALSHMVLPAVAMGANGAAAIARQVRSSLGEVLDSQYVRTLRAKGLPDASVVWKHGLRNIVSNLLTIIGLQFNRLLSIAVVIEAVFAIPGLGSLVIPAALARDFPVVQGVVLVTAVLVMASNLLTDICVTLLDPRVRERQ
jgi:peptide/nickel transport system permease protein